MKIKENIMKWLVWASIALTAATLAFIVLFVVVKGLPYLKPSLFSLTYNSVNVSLTPALISTVILTALALVIAVPFGVFASIFLVEYAKRGSKIVKFIRAMSETLAGIPSIVFGLFGMLFFVTFLGFGFSVLSGALTLAIMVLPIVLRSSEEALLAVPDSLREGSLSLGAGKLRTIFKVVLPAAAPGIFGGVILSSGRVVGETAALIYTAGTVAQIPYSPLQSARTLSVHMYALSGESLHVGEGYATAIVLLVLVAVINVASSAILKRANRNRI
ncbi:MAG: phosphate ABC transporter permease PstA [Clostridiales Family XIII bacterium]|jgi:phosphate transport system permease protein|nr:phosphate ABC transporter permease PstA [Clostridiales Family XIII bacterium]